MLTARRYTDDDAAQWDAFVGASARGTLLHTRRFLRYHGARFADRSLVITRGDRWEAVIPAATDPRRADAVLSHPGATWGGVITPRIGQTALAEESLRAAQARWSAEGARALTVRAPMAHLSAQPDESDLHALYRLGAQQVRCDLWSVAHLDRPRRRDDIASARRGARLGVTVTQARDPGDYAAFHALLAETLRARHDVAPTHTLDELLDLRERLAAAQSLWLARLPDGSLGAGAWVLWHRDDVAHTQYLAASASAREHRALDTLLEGVFEAVTPSARCVSFGTSTEHDGRVLNAPLMAFKGKFGGGAALQHFLRWEW
ncbi:MAG: GNAT family N-acetyltransferase [Polyangiales bacterium]